MPKFNRTVKFTKSNIEKIPQDKAVIYKIKDGSGTNIYTGIAGRGRSQERLLEHKNVPKDKIPGGSKFQIAQVKTKVRAHVIEKQIIKREQPKFNVQHR